MLLLEAEAVEPVALAAAAPRTPAAACRGGRFYLSEGRRGDPMGGDPMGGDPRGGGRWRGAEPAVCGRCRLPAGGGLGEPLAGEMTE